MNIVPCNGAMTLMKSGINIDDIVLHNKKTIVKKVDTYLWCVAKTFYVNVEHVAEWLRRSTRNQRVWVSIHELSVMHR